MDGLTNVYNRSYFMRRAEKIFESLIQSGGSLSVIMFDIDHFKRINDTYGHEAGDYVLTNVAAVAKEGLSKKDFIGRYGGEEFIMCLPNTTLMEAYMAANRVKSGISEKFIPNHDNQIKVTASFGIANAIIVADDYNHSLHSLMREADKALYVAKKNGRNCIQTYEEIKIKKVH
jgi:diguanylate cyclase (GGDEF)-like protein